MVLSLHIIIALLSILFSSYMLFRPTKHGLRLSYILITLTLASGTTLVATAPAHMPQACVSGIIYVSVAMLITVAARHKLARFAATQ